MIEPSHCSRFWVKTIDELDDDDGGDDDDDGGADGDGDVDDVDSDGDNAEVCCKTSLCGHGLLL